MYVCTAFLLIMLLTSPLSSQEFRSFDLMDKQMKSLERQLQQEDQEREARSLQRELDADRQEHLYTNEMAHLYARLAETENQFFGRKWNNHQVDIGLQLDIKMIKDELKRREKQSAKYVRRKIE